MFKGDSGGGGNMMTNLLKDFMGSKKGGGSMGDLLKMAGKGMPGMPKLPKGKCTAVDDLALD